jgi:hypothetical protein
MGETWITSLEHMLDESGAIASPKEPGRKLAEHVVAIVAMASRPEVVPPQNTGFTVAGVLVENRAPA